MSASLRALLRVAAPALEGPLGADRVGQEHEDAAPGSRKDRSPPLVRRDYAPTGTAAPVRGRRTASAKAIAAMRKRGGESDSLT
jgi:hypothetical protein